MPDQVTIMIMCIIVGQIVLMQLANHFYAVGPHWTLEQQNYIITVFFKVKILLAHEIRDSHFSKLSFWDVYRQI